MIIYNVTIKVERAVANEYLEWLRNEHLPDMMYTGLFSDYRLSRLVEPADGEGETFVIQYHCDSVENYQSYMNEHSETMRQKGLDRFGNQFIAFRTVMELMN